MARVVLSKAERRALTAALSAPLRTSSRHYSPRGWHTLGGGPFTLKTLQALAAKKLLTVASWAEDSARAEFRITAQGRAATQKAAQA